MLDKKDVITAATIYNLMFFVAFTIWACFLLVSASLVHSNPWHHLTDREYTSLLLLHKSYNKLYRFYQCPPVMHSFVKPLHKVLQVEISTSVMFPPHVGLHILPPNLKIQPWFIWHWDSCFFPECQLVGFTDSHTLAVSRTPGEALWLQVSPASIEFT